MSKKETETKEITVLTEEKIQQKMAGYKSAYTKKINSAKTAQERKALLDARDEFLANRLSEIQKENKHQIMRRAGVMSWETRRQNSQKRVVTSTPTKCTKCTAKKETKPSTTRKNRGSKVGIRVIHK